MDHKKIAMLAADGGPIPDNLKQWEQNAYIALRGLYRQYRAGVIDRETAVAEKRRIVKAARDAEGMEAFRDKLAQSTVTLWREVEAAGSAYARNRTLDNADRLWAAVLHLPQGSRPKSYAGVIGKDCESAQAEREGIMP